jgi:predicted HicB family RNase H-like nuclease
MTKQVRVMLSEEVHAQIKARAALEGVTLAAWIAAAIDEKLSKPKKKGGKKAA